MIGSIAAILTTFLQAIKVIKTKDTESYSTGMYLMQVLGAPYGWHMV